MNPSHEPPMNDELIADYLGGEMTAERRAQFEHLLRRDPALAADMAGMQQTLSLMKRLESTAAPAAVRDGARRRILRPVMRYAAVIAAAFVTGFAARGGSGLQQPPTSVPSNHDARAGKQSEPKWEQRAAMVYANAPGGNSLGKSLMALVHSARP